MADLLGGTQSYLNLVNEGVWMPIIHPATRAIWGEDEGRPARIKLLGMDSAPVREAQNDFENRALQQMQRRGRKVTQEQIKRRQVDLLVAATVAWENIDWQSEENVALTPKRAREIYSHANMEWLRKDVDLFIGDATNFGGEEAEESASLDDGVAYLEDAEKKSSTGVNGALVSSGGQ